MTQILHVPLPQHPYSILIGEGASVFESIQSYIQGKQILIVTNTVVAPLYLAQIQAYFDPERYTVNAVILPDGEAYKNLESYALIMDALMIHRYSRDCTLIALGGGVIGDMTGFAAATYQRGVNFIQIPTTLLSQVDSSVGGKTGINHPSGKNMIGAFKQPKVVFIDLNMLDTLNDREFSAGLAEVIKYAFIRDPAFLTWLEENMTALLARERRALAYAILTSCAHKAEVVTRDEFEQGERALLNLGHTFGHAIENKTGYGTYLHGEAVSIGMVMASVMSEKMGLISVDDMARVRHILSSARLPIEVRGMTVDDFMSGMSIDKKNISGRIRFILFQAIGQAFITSTYTAEDLLHTLSEAVQ